MKQPIKKPRATRNKLGVKSTSEVRLSPKGPTTKPLLAPHHDSQLLERASVLWQLGDWDGLLKIERAEFIDHPDRAKVALLVAAAHLQTSLPEEAKQLILLASEWGSSKRQVAQALMASIHNTIARAATAAGNDKQALSHFEQSLVTAFPDCDAPLLAKSSRRHQMEELGLEPDTEGRLQWIKALALANHSCGAITQNPPLAPNQAANTETLAFYKQLDKGAEKDAPPPFILLDSKSLPRCGLHYLKNTLASLLGDHFSFCEWYQEVGCCKQRPCALTGYARHSQDTGKFRLRLIKSHDFENNEPMLPPSKIIQSLVLVRDPLFTLTSWFELYQLENYNQKMLEHGIDIRKVWLLHEKEVLTSACQILDENFIGPSQNELASWLIEKSHHIVSFMNKWVKSALENPSPHVHLVSYDEVDSFIVRIVQPYRLQMNATNRKLFDDFRKKGSGQFVKRTNPFTARTPRVEAYIREQSGMFQEAARQIILNDKSGYFASMLGRSHEHLSISPTP